MVRREIQNSGSRRWTELPGDERRRFCGDSDNVLGEAFARGQSRRTAIAGVVLTAISPLLGQDGWLHVAVTDATGAGVNGAEVSVGQRKGKSNALGAVSFVGLPVGRYEVAVHCPGFKIWRGTFNVLNGTEMRVDARLEVAVGGGMTIEPLRSEATGRLRVSVRDATAGALLNANVTVKCGIENSRKARVDDSGVASLTELPIGKCQVEVRAPGFKDWLDTYSVTAGAEGRLEARLEVSDPGTKVAVRPKPIGRRFIDWLSSCARK